MIVGIYHHASCPLGYRRANLRTIHLQANIPSNQDDSADQVSSLPELFTKSGCFRRPNFIPAGTFQQTRMLPPTKFHPCQSFPANQDDSAATKYFPQSKMPYFQANTAENKDATTKGA